MNRQMASQFPPSRASPSAHKQARADASEAQPKDALAKFGLTLEPATAVEGAGKAGVVVAGVNPDGTAAQKGLQTGDVILAVGGKTVSRPAEVAAALDSARADGKKSVLMQVKNDNGTHFVAMPTQALS